MIDYNAIKGKLVQSLSSDPSITTSYEGQVWYNSTSSLLKSVAHIKATSSGANLPTTFYYPGGVGPTTATLGISGVGPSPIPAHTVCVDYNGAAWTSAASIPVGSRAGYDFGTATAAVYAGGDYQSPGASPTITLRTAEYDGSSWTTGNNISEQGSFGAVTGTLTIGLDLVVIMLLKQPQVQEQFPMMVQIGLLFQLQVQILIQQEILLEVAADHKLLLYFLVVVLQMKVKQNRGMAHLGQL